MNLTQVDHAKPLAAGRMRDAQAFTLVEVLVAVLAAAVSVVSLYAGFSSGFAAVETSRESLRATQVMLEKLETIRLYSWSQLNTAGFMPTNFSAPFNPSTNAVGGFNYQGTVSIGPAPISNSYSNDLKQVTVTVNWTSANVVRSRTMTTLVSAGNWEFITGNPIAGNARESTRRSGRFRYRESSKHRSVRKDGCARPQVHANWKMALRRMNPTDET